jgi:hypothetical protein
MLLDTDISLFIKVLSNDSCARICHSYPRAYLIRVFIEWSEPTDTHSF